ncbi:MAG: hypothetical protein IJR99_16210 [Kiritimatiellae bacterium]|nr:hypothetical protein [Kiritimatiellia bacterium]
MRNILVMTISLLAVAVVTAKDFKTMSKEEINATDKAVWGNGMTLTGEDLREYRDLWSTLNQAMTLIDHAEKDKVFQRVDADASMQALFTFIVKPFVKNVKRVESPPGKSTGNDSRDTGLKALDALTLMFRHIDQNTRKKVSSLVDWSVTMKLPQRYTNWERIIERFDAWKHTKTFEKFDKSFGEFMRLVEKMERDKSGAVAGTVLLMASGLDKFADNQCRKEAFFDRDLRTIDNYLYTIRNEAYQAHKEYLDQFEKYRDEAISALRTDWEYFKEHGINLPPVARGRLEMLLRSFEALLIHANEYVPKCRELFKKIDDTSSETGKLRTNTGFATHRAFLASGATQANGCPGYTRRVRVALEDCKAAYLKALDRMNKEAKNNGRPVIEGWR